MKLYYFDIPFRAEPIRLLLKYYSVKFEDIRISRKEWFEMRILRKPNTIMDKLEFNQVPMLELPDGKVIVQSHAILHNLGCQYKCLPLCEEGLYNIKNIMDAVDDMILKASVIYSPFSPYTPEHKKVLFNKFESEDLVTFFTAMDKRLKENCRKDFIYGDGYTIADFCLLAFYISMKTTELKGIFLNNLKNYSLLEGYFRIRCRDFKCYMKELFPKVKLIYFDTEYSAECIRLLLKNAKVDFKDIRLTPDQFYKDYINDSIQKQLPELKYGKQTLCQTAAIMKFLEIKYSYTPFTLFDRKKEFYQITVEKIMGAVKDLIDKTSDYLYIAPTEQAKEKSWNEYIKEKIPTYFKVFEDILKGNVTKEFLVGTSYTIADFYLLGFARGLIYSPKIPKSEFVKAELDKFPDLKTYIETMLKDFN